MQQAMIQAELRSLIRRGSAVDPAATHQHGLNALEGHEFFVFRGTLE